MLVFVPTPSLVPPLADSVPLVFPALPRMADRPNHFVLIEWCCQNVMPAHIEDFRPEAGAQPCLLALRSKTSLDVTVEDLHRWVRKLEPVKLRPDSGSFFKGRTSFSPFLLRLTKDLVAASIGLCFVINPSAFNRLTGKRIKTKNRDTCQSSFCLFFDLFDS